MTFDFEPSLVIAAINTYTGNTTNSVHYGMTIVTASRQYDIGRLSIGSTDIKMNAKTGTFLSGTTATFEPVQTSNSATYTYIAFGS